MLPQIAFLRKEGRIRSLSNTGASCKVHIRQKKIIEVFGYKCSYEGEIDDEGRAFGQGMLKTENGVKYYGTFIDDRLEGVCVQIGPGKSRLISEIKNRQYFGK